MEELLIQAYNKGCYSEFLNFIIESYDLVIVEGYECTGKSTFIQNMFGMSDDFSVYRPRYELPGMDESLPRSMRSLAGLFAYDYHTASNRYETFVLDRGVPSGMVYGKLFQGKSYDDYIPFLKVMKAISKKILVIYCSHEDKIQAEVIHKNAVKSRKTLDMYDEKDFNEYYEIYEEFDTEFRKVLDMIGVDTVEYNAVPDLMKVMKKC